MCLFQNLKSSIQRIRKYMYTYLFFFWYIENDLVSLLKREEIFINQSSWFLFNALRYMYFFKVCIWDLLECVATAVLQRTLKNYALWKNFSKCVKFGTKSTQFEKKIFFQSALIRGILTHFEKKPPKNIFALQALFFLFKNFKYNY